MSTVLSLFPGLGIWEIGFREAGFCVVRGPELLLGHDVRDFDAFPGVFSGIIAGIPCQAFSRANNLNKGSGHEPRFGDMTPEFERIREQVAPKWWLTENVPEAPIPKGTTWNAVLDSAAFGATQARRRRFCSNLCLMPRPVARHEDVWPTVTASEHKVSAGSSAQNIKARAGRKVGRRMTIEEINESFGMPAEWETPALKIEYQYHMRGNAVPLPLARALANAIVTALKEKT